MSEGKFVPETTAEQKAHDEAYIRGLAAAQRMFADDQNKEIRDENERLQLEIELDAKTKLKTFPAFKQRVKEHLESKQTEREDTHPDRKHPEHYAIAIIDIDDFKLKNSKYPYEKVDEVLLIPTARTIDESIRRENDIFAETGRFGGEEFVVFLDGSDLEGAVHKLKEMKSKINEINMPTDEGPDHVGVSIGVTSFGPHVPFEAAFESANYALKRAKEIEGKNQIVASYYAAPGASES
jgi:diguanylate cyclase (GGDEF)-like protein